MGLKLFWTQFAVDQLAYIYDFYKDVANKSVAKKIVSEIFSAPEILIDQPEIGQIEDLLVERDQEFRYIIVRHFKIIYWKNVDESRVEIVDVFDTRQNPIKMSRNKR